jgi:uncharacterized protein with ParB-like and HNH nuclease domain
MSKEVNSMHADAVPLQKILNSNLQMVIPIFQREYSWDREPVRILWEDILKLYQNIQKSEDATHFLGPIVRVEVSQSSVDTRKFYLIDGQQRIVTLMVLLSCIRNIVIKDEDTMRKIESGYLLNYQERGENRYKLIPSEGDRENFRKIIDGEKKLSNNKLKDAFEYFVKKLKQEKDRLNLEKLRGAIIKNLILVNIDVDKTENPYLIFESLNAKGTPLTQADLIRNYIFMKIAEEAKQREMYRDYWRPMEQYLGKELEKFFWRYSLKDGIFVKINRTYANLKMELETNTAKNAESELKKLREYSAFYKKLIDPEKEENSKIKERIIRHNRWEIRTAYPFLLNIYKDYSEGKVTTEQFCELMDIIESFVIRRFFCKDPTNKLNTLFIGLYSKIKHANLMESLRKALKENWPSDERFTDGLRTFPIYSSGSEKCSLILETLEKSYHHKEPVNYNGLQIEHVMPKMNEKPENLSDKWKNMLESNYVAIHQKYLHTLANLTLSGYNQELSVKPFNEKKKLLQNSHLELNKYFLAIDKWNEQEIKNRGDLLGEKALHVWKGPTRK